MRTKLAGIYSNVLGAGTDDRINSDGIGLSQFCGDHGIKTSLIGSHD
jgi:hypothetical protein